LPANPEKIGIVFLAEQKTLIIQLSIGDCRDAEDCAAKKTVAGVNLNE
jgi:hypothetical protein